MRGKLGVIAINSALTVGSLGILCLMLELFVFRFIWLASDVPQLDFVDDVVRYAPNQAGVWRIRDEIAAPFRINAQGWNAGTGDYIAQRQHSVKRIALIGDSYVEALQVANTNSAAELLERRLTERSPSEVLRFGISGAPLSQYVHMAEREVQRYRPDWIVVVMVHNDFDESYQFKQGRYTSSFMKFHIEDGRVTKELAPAPWRRGPIEVLRETATAGFLLYRWQVRPQAIIDLVSPRPARAVESPYAANVEIGAILQQRRNIEGVADHATKRLSDIAESIGARLMLVMDGDRAAIYSGDPSSPALEINRIAAAAAANRQVTFLDLHPIFAAHWALNRQRFNFASDGHWNELGHWVAAQAIASFIEKAR